MYPCLRIWEGEGPGQSEPASIIVGEENLGSYGSHASQLACIIARILGEGRPGETKLACIVARAHHCPHFREGEGRANVARVHHRSHVSLRAYWGGEGPGNHRSRASQFACIIARILGGWEGRAIVARVDGRSHVSLPACLKGERAGQSWVARITVRMYHRPNIGGGEAQQTQLACIIVHVYRCAYICGGEKGPSNRSSRAS